MLKWPLIIIQNLLQAHFLKKNKNKEKRENPFVAFSAGKSIAVWNAEV